MARFQLENVLVHGDGTHKLCDFGSLSTRSGRIADKLDRIHEEDAIQRFTTAVYRSTPKSIMRARHNILLLWVRHIGSAVHLA
jgi:hypothetical protein